jgi:hypothetical protein
MPGLNVVYRVTEVPGVDPVSEVALVGGGPSVTAARMVSASRRTWIGA